jgi:hypothetical protein
MIGSCAGCWERPSPSSASGRSGNSTQRRSPPGGSRSRPATASTRAGAPASARARRRLGNDRRQSSETRRRQPVATAQGAAPVRVVGRARCRRNEFLAPPSADGDLRGRYRALSGRMARAQMARHRSRAAGCLRPPLVHEGSVEAEVLITAPKRGNRCAPSFSAQPCGSAAQ